MKKLVLIGLSLFAFASSASGRDCVAILLADGLDNPTCLAMDEQLEALADGLFNDTACNSDISWFTLGDYNLTRDKSSGNLVNDENQCEWEVRAPSGRN